MAAKLRAPDFWWRRHPSLAADLLWPLSLIYGHVAGRRMSRPANFTASVPVICVGNFVVGGTGKTPMALALADMLRQTGEQPVFLTRGFGGTLGRALPAAVDPAMHGAAEVGDEALLLAAHGPTIVSADRVAGARLAQTLGSVLLMDDGFQNPALAKDLSLVLVDAATGIGNGLCMPAGPLRAPLAAQLPRADAVILVGDQKEAVRALRQTVEAAGLPVLATRLVAEPGHGLTGTRVLAFAGIGRPEKFFDTLALEGAEVAVRRSFGDHHVYTEEDARRLLAEAEEHGLVPVTTEKDLVRLARPSETDHAPMVKALLGRLQILKVRMVAEEGERLSGLVRDRLAAARG